MLAVAGLKRGDIFLVGCSSSEIVGGQIGHASSFETAQAVWAAIKAVLDEAGVWLAAQCCEHLNRALIVERACAERAGAGLRCSEAQGGRFVCNRDMAGGG